jgi:hypothetical protein
VFYSMAAGLDKEKMHCERTVLIENGVVLSLLG